MLEKRVCAAQRDTDEAVVRGRKPVSVEVLPKVADRLRALFICGADREVPLHLAGEFPAQSAVPLAGD
jgi:hypothetical protein